MDKLEGFELYLKVAEQDDLNLRHPPDMTPELFERYLPYAVALGVEQAWAEQFTSVFAALANGGVDYQPRWSVTSTPGIWVVLPRLWVAVSVPPSPLRLRPRVRHQVLAAAGRPAVAAAVVVAAAGRVPAARG